MNITPLDAARFLDTCSTAIVLVGVRWLRHTKSLGPALGAGPGDRLRPRA